MPESTSKDQKKKKLKRIIVKNRKLSLISLGWDETIAQLLFASGTLTVL